MIDLTTEQTNTNRILDCFLSQQRKARSIMAERLRSRGPDNITEQGIGGVILRMRHDKMVRLTKVARAALLKQSDPEFDTEAYLADNNIHLVDVVDDLQDISNYALMTIMLLEGEWEGKK